MADINRKNSMEIAKSISDAAEITGLSEESVKLLNYWKSQPAISYNSELIDELIMRLPEYVYPKYRELRKERKNSVQGRDADNVSNARGAGGYGPSSKNSEREEQIASEICEIIFGFMAHNNEVSLSECKNYAAARRIFPCTRERLKRIQDELVNERNREKDE